MPDLDAKLITEILLAAALLAMLTLALRLAVTARNRRRTGGYDRNGGYDRAGGGGHAGGHRRVRRGARWGVVAVRERDFGLLATVAMVPSADEAARLRRQLADAGIRATTAADRGGHRVLVFANELYRARRVGGTPT